MAPDAGHERAPATPGPTGTRRELLAAAGVLAVALAGCTRASEFVTVAVVDDFAELDDVIEG